MGVHEPKGLDGSAMLCAVIFAYMTSDAPSAVFRILIGKACLLSGFQSIAHS
jgi:hypothetical protein